MSHSTQFGFSGIDEPVQNHRWSLVISQLIEIGRLKPNWNGEGADIPSPELISFTASVIVWLRERADPAPNDLYLLPDGNILLEWHLPNEIIERLEIEGVGKGQLMVSYPNHPAKFYDDIFGFNAKSPFDGYTLPSNSVVSLDEMDCFQQAA